jgi:PTS system nitrogen regulatory IIA component
MLQLSDFLNLASVKSKIEAKDKTGVICELADLILAGHPALRHRIDRKTAVHLLSERERLAGTGVGNEIAIPHAASETLDRIYGGFARASEGIDFGAIDGRPSRFFFVLLSPKANPRVHIRALSRITRLLQPDSIRELLSQARDGQAVFDVLQVSERQLNDSLGTSNHS